MPTIAEIDDDLYDLYNIIADDIADGVVPVLNNKITSLYAEIFKQAIEDGYGSSFAKSKVGNIDFERLAKMEANAYYFAACKQARYLRDLQLAAQGMTPEAYSAYKQSYHYMQNRQWLEREQQMVLANAGAAKRWHEMEELKEALPNLKYVTVGDGNVRPAHQILDGINLPMDNEFWLTHYPPLGYGCRCDTQQNDSEKLTPSKKLPNKNEMGYIQKAYAFNAGIQNKVVGFEHPYIAKIWQNDSDWLNLCNHCTEAETLVTFKTNKDFKLAISRFVDWKFLKQNYSAAELLLKDKNNVTLTAFHKFKSIGIEQPDFIVNNNFSDLKTPVGDYLKGLDSGINEANKQGAKIAIIDLRKYDTDMQSIINKIKGKTNVMNKKIEFIWVFLKDGTIHKQKRHL